jgi:hypothetical protein
MRSAMVVTKQGLIVKIPGKELHGQLFNGTGQFHGDIFIFASEDGVISGWRLPWDERGSAGDKSRRGL